MISDKTWVMDSQTSYRERIFVNPRLPGLRMRTTVKADSAYPVQGRGKCEVWSRKLQRWEEVHRIEGTQLKCVPYLGGGFYSQPKAPEDFEEDVAELERVAMEVLG